MKIKKLNNKIKNKKALSDIISYVLLITIALALAAGVFAWVKFYIPQGEKETCPQETALSISDSWCDNLNKTLNITLINKGYFNIDGFFIKAANETGKPAVRMLSSTDFDMSRAYGPGRYDFALKVSPGQPAQLKNEQSINLEFSYLDINTIRKLQVQPYLHANQTKGILLCPYIEIPVSGCD